MGPEFFEDTDRSVARLRKLHTDALLSEHGDIAFNQMLLFVRQLEDEFGRSKLERCVLFHLLIGSSVDPEQAAPTFLDLPGKWSIASFIERMAIEFAQTRE